MNHQVNRRKFNALLATALASWGVFSSQSAWALSLDDLTNADVTKGIKTALETGAASAVSLLGRSDGFLGNAQVRIPLPSYLEDAAKLLRTFGQAGPLDELVTAMNRGAEAAVPLAKNLLLGAVKSMTVTDAKNIITGSDTAVTEFFSSKTRPALYTQFLPVVTKATDKVGLAAKYNQVAAKASEAGLLKESDASIQQYVCGKALDGLFFMIGQEEQKIRHQPLDYANPILKKVFGSLG